MKPLLATLLSMPLLIAMPGSVSSQAQTVDLKQGTQLMEITRKADMKTTAGPAANFTGKVTVTAPFQRAKPSRVSGAIVYFEPGARTAWHKHPLGQTLIVTEGIGWTQVEGGQIHKFHAGDQLWCPADRKHWHGATPTTGMIHIAIQESLNGSPVTWMEHVTDAQYLAGPSQD
jgi:quercetin dioxygenase-like cupin family protein